MTNLLEARILLRHGLVAGVFLIWPVAFFALVRSAQTPAEIFVLVPAAVSAMLPGVRGRLVGSLIGVLGISTFHVAVGTGSFTQLSQGRRVVFGMNVNFGVIGDNCGSNTGCG